MLQTAEYLPATAHFNSTIQFVVDKFGPLSKERTTGEICMSTKWRGFDDAEDPEEPIYDKWIDVPNVLKINQHELAEKGDKFALKGVKQVKEWEENPSDDLPSTIGDTYPGSYSFASTRVIYL
jgi:hypothetical protein